MIPDRKRSFVWNLHQVIQKHGPRTAVETAAGDSVSYAQLWQRALALRAYFRDAGVGKGDIVAILLPRSIDYVVGFIAVWLCEAVALPLDLATPPGRLNLILNEAQPVLILRSTPSISGGISNVAAEVPEQPLTDPAYLIYTSGSTGSPKGVLVSHRGLTPVLAAQIELFKITPDSRCFWLHGTGFDASLSDIGTALLAGAALCLAAEPQVTRDIQALLGCLRRMRITHIDLPPALLPYLEDAAVPDCLTTVIIGGEVCPAPIIRHWASRLRLINVYGPTEATICTSMTVCDDQWQRAWIGDPLPEVEYAVCDEGGATVPAGTPGELHIYGGAVALGYPWLPQLTQKRFVRPNGFKTGDLVVRHRCGRHEFLGRVDRQFKLHGRLICPEEVERALLGTDLVRRAHVLPWMRGRRPLLAAAVETSAGLDELRAAVRKSVPEWMVPSAWSLCERIPCLSNAKPDAEAIRGLLADQTASRMPGPGCCTTAERQIASLFEACLQMPHIGLDEDFFTDLGGDSLAVVALIALASERNVPLPPDAIHRGRTVAGVAKLLAAGHSESVPRAELEPDVAKGTSAIRSWTFPKGPALPVRHVLLTGATGFLGAAVLGELLRQPDVRVVCLGRGEASQLRLRIMAAAASHGFAELLGDAGSRWTVAPGDIGSESFGWDVDRWDALA